MAMMRTLMHSKGTLLCVVLIGSVVALDLAGTAVAAEPGQDTESEKIEAVTYCRIRDLREEICLRNEDLAAMGCTEANANAVFETLLGWYEAKKASLEAARETQRDAEKALRSALRRIGMGPRDENLIATVPALKAAVAQARAQRKTIVESAIAAVEAKLTSAQKGVWTIARANASLPSAYRYTPGMTPGQVKTLHRASRTRSRKLAVARTKAQRSDATSVFNAVETDTLTGAQKTAIAAAKANMRQNMPGVLKAFAEVLPLPDDLKIEAADENPTPPN